METMVNFEKLFDGIYKNKKVLVTGHTGFKGSWLSLWLKMMGADVYGYSLASPYELNHIKFLNLDINEKIADLRDAETLTAYMQEVQPDIVLHLAAQALVRPSYDDPVETFSTNIMGTLHVFEACRKTDSVKAIVNVTSDKCYENNEWIWGYRENDPMGGYDPYSVSKGMSELMTASYRNSFFNLKDYGSKHHVLLASARARNVIGGGDWATDRLIPDMMKAANKNDSVLIRNPKATRPWQHVLEPLSGYLLLGAKLLQKEKTYAEGWNFGPEMGSNLSVGEIVNLSSKTWEAVIPTFGTNTDEHHEANLLMLDCSKANKMMKWKPVWKIKKTLEKTIGWYKEYYQNKQINTEKDIKAYVESARDLGVEWADN
jgi:CDP-glucose 4,6-dehydratase